MNCFYFFKQIEIDQIEIDQKKATIKNITQPIAISPIYII